MISRTHQPSVIYAEIERYEAMTSEEIEAELDRKGIDSRAAIESVKALVQRRLEFMSRPFHSRKRGR
jgi:hypothetical protein